MARKRNSTAIVWFDEAARRWSVTPETLREWIDEGRFPEARGHGNRLFYTEQDLDYVVHFAGRWKPRGKGPETAGSGRKEPPKRGKERDSEGSNDEAG